MIKDQPLSTGSRPSKWDNTLEVASRWATIQIENSVRGKVPHDEAEIYYFIYSLSGIHQLGRWPLGSRHLFFLEHDSGVLRTICDGRSTCVIPIFTGAHPDFHPDPNIPMRHTIVDLLLTRGKDCTDEEMTKAADSPNIDRAFTFSEDYTIEKLREIVQTGAPPVSKRACESIVNLGYRCEAPKR